MDELMSKLSDLLLSSGFGNPWAIRRRQRSDDAGAARCDPRSAVQRRRAARRPAREAVRRCGRRRPGAGARAARRVDPADHRAHEGVGLHHARRRISRPNGSGAREGGGGEGEPAEVKFEVTDKALDFLGYRALRDLLGSVGHSSAGRHDTRDLSTGIEASGAPKPLRVRRHHEPRRDRDDPQRRQAAPATAGALVEAPTGIDIDYQDLMVAQGEYQSSCATVLMLDCSHSMILYGEDRFTPAKRVAMALSHLIRTQYPGDTLHAVLFHDSRRGDSAARARPRARRPVLHQHARGPARGAPHPRAAAQGHAADRDDHRRQAVGADAAGRPHLQEPVRPRSVRHRRDASPKCPPAPRPAS